MGWDLHISRNKMESYRGVYLSLYMRGEQAEGVRCITPQAGKVQGGLYGCIPKGYCVVLTGMSAE